MIKILWPHTYSPEAKNSGVFMFQLVDPLKKQGIEVIPLYIGGIKKNPVRFIKSIPDIMQTASKCDLVHAQYGSMCGLLSVFLHRKKLLSLRGSDWYGIAGASRQQKIHSFLARSFTKLSLPFYKKIIVMSNRMANEVNNKHPRCSVVAIADGIDLDKFYPMDKADCRKKLGMDANAIYVLFTSASEGNFVKREWLAHKACELARNEIAELKIMIAEKIDHDLMPYYINACNLTIITSLHEGWPNCIKEALACNVPFVATDISDLQEIANKTTTCMVVEADEVKLSKAIIQISKVAGGDDLRNFISDMTVENCSRKLKEEYEKVIFNR